MNAQAAAWFILQAIKAGVSIRNIAMELNASGEVPEETWDEIAADVKAANSTWEDAPGPK